MGASEEDDAVVDSVSADAVSPSKVTCDGGTVAGRPGTGAGDCLVVWEEWARRPLGWRDGGASSVVDMLRLLVLVVLLLLWLSVTVVVVPSGAGRFSLRADMIGVPT